MNEQNMLGKEHNSNKNSFNFKKNKKILLGLTFPKIISFSKIKNRRG